MTPTSRDEPLDEVLRREPQGLGSTRATHIALQVLTELARAHGMSIVHGDVRPSNVLVSGEGRSEVARLRGFGGAIPRPAARRPGNAAAHVLDYRAPELGQGEAGCAADIWAAGVLFHEMLSGQLPPANAGREFAPSGLDATLPLAIASALAGALRNDPGQRLEGPVLVQMLKEGHGLAFDLLPVPPPVTHTRRERRRRRPVNPVGFDPPRPWDSEKATLLALLVLAGAAILAPACLHQL